MHWEKQLHQNPLSFWAIVWASTNATWKGVIGQHGHVGIDNATWKGVIEQHGDPDINKNGRCLLQFCATNGLCIMNTFFQHKRIHKYTWCRDFLGQRSLIDFCIVSADLFSTVSDVRVKRGAELSTDHHLVVCTLKALKPLKKRKTFRSRKTY